MQAGYNFTSQVTVIIKYLNVKQTKKLTSTLHSLKQGISSRTRCETSSCNESQHFRRRCSFLRPLDGHSMTRFIKLRVMNRFTGSERFTSPSLPNIIATNSTVYTDR